MGQHSCFAALPAPLSRAGGVPGGNGPQRPLASVHLLSAEGAENARPILPPWEADRPFAAFSRTRKGGRARARAAAKDRQAPTVAPAARGGAVADPSAVLNCVSCAGTLTAQGVAVYRFRDASYCAACRQRAG
jgi:hypothetical protein